MSKNPMFLQFLNRERGVTDLLSSFSRSSDPITADAASKALNNPPDLEEFRSELEDAVRDIISDGLDDDFKDFVNHYMSCMVEDYETMDTPHGLNQDHQAKVGDSDGPWIQGFICYNLCLYIKAFGLENVKSCKVCEKLFAHKGKYSLYCSDSCKKKGKALNDREKKQAE